MRGAEPYLGALITRQIGVGGPPPIATTKSSESDDTGKWPPGLYLACSFHQDARVALPSRVALVRRESPATRPRESSSRFLQATDVAQGVPFLYPALQPARLPARAPRPRRALRSLPREEGDQARSPSLVGARPSEADATQRSRGGPREQARSHRLGGVTTPATVRGQRSRANAYLPAPPSRASLRR